MIRAEKIFKSFGEQEVLKGIDFTFETGKTNLIIGRSGAGKTVLLKILVGLYGPTSGKVWYDDTEFYALNPAQLRALRLEVGMLFQGNALFDSMTIEENISFPMDMFTQMTKKEKLNRVRPETLGQAGRIDGMTPAALTLLLAHLRRLDRQNPAVGTV